MSFYPNEIIINDEYVNRHKDELFVPKIAGKDYGRGYDPDEVEFVESSMFSTPADIPLILKSEWSDRIKEQEERGTRISDLLRRAGIPSTDQNGHGYCVPAGTLIRMGNGTQKPIEQVKLLDSVLTAEGNVGKVKQCHVRHYTGDLVELKLYGHGHFRCTPNHSILTQRGYVEAGELTKEDFIRIPRFAPQSCEIVLTASHIAGVKRRVPTLPGEKSSWGSVIPDTHELGINHLPDVVKLNESTGRIFGLWLAEGHIDKSRRTVVWSFSTAEKKTLVADLVQLLADEWGIDAVVRPGPATDTVTQVMISGVMWTQLFASLLGRLSHGKRIHADLMQGPQEFLSALFWGWMDGDGYTKRSNKTRRYPHEYKNGATVSHCLALNLYDIAMAIGYSPSIVREKPQENIHAEKRRPVYKIQVIPNRSNYRKNYRLQVEVDCVWRKVRFLNRIPHDGLVFNIGVEGDNSYVAESISVHNCWAYSTGGCVIALREINNQPYLKLNPHSVAAIIKRGADQGGWCGQSARFLKEHGIGVMGNSPGDWPEHSRNLAYDTPELRESMKLHRVTEDWIDLRRQEWDDDMTFAQVASCLLSGIPVAGDFNWWGHSVLLCDLVEVSSGSFGIRIRNSWTDNWGDKGFSVLQGSKAIPNGAVALRATGGSIT